MQCNEQLTTSLGISGKWQKLFEVVNFTNCKNPKLSTYLFINNASKLQIEKNEMGGACGAYGGWERCAQGSDW